MTRKLQALLGRVFARRDKNARGLTKKGRSEDMIQIRLRFTGLKNL
jgi:hypothetical protein